MNIQNLAKKICIYNGQSGTQKQIEKCIKSFASNTRAMQRYIKERNI
jgi:hypothetical protein